MTIRLDSDLGISSTGNITTAGYMHGNGAFLTGINTGANIDLTAVTTDIIPAANVTQSLGNATNQWLDLWVSNATIYLNSIPLGVGNTGVLQFNGNDIVTSGPNVVNTGNVETTGNVVGGNLVITAGGGVTFADGTVQTSAYGNANVAAYLPTYSGNLGNITTTGDVVLAGSPDANITATTNNLTISASNYVIIDSLNNGQIEIGTSDVNVGVVVLGSATKNVVVRSELAEFDGNITANYVIADGSSLTNLDLNSSIIAINSNVANTNSEVSNVSNAVITLSQATTDAFANTNANVATVASDLANTNSNVANLTVTVSAQGNAIGNLQAGAYSNANVAAYLPTYTGNLNQVNVIDANHISVAGNIITQTLYVDIFEATSSLSVGGNVTTGNLAANNIFSNAIQGTTISSLGNVTGNYIIGDGSLLTNLNGANVVGAVALATNANVAYSVDGANVVGEVALANTVSNPLQPNITALGTITSLTANAINVNGLFTANGNAQFNQDVYFAGNVTLPGNIIQISGNSGSFYGNAVTGFGALYAGLPAGYTLLNNEVVQFSDSYDGYTQVSHRNINGGAQATTDYVATADNGDDTTNFVDLGVAGSGYDGLLANNSLGTSLYANDGYLYAKGNVAGGNLVIGSQTVGGVVRIIANGASNIGDVVATFGANGLQIGDITAKAGSPAPTISGFSFTGLSANITGNVTGGNIRTAGLVSATGNVTAGNVNTAIVSATGTVQAGNLRTAGLISATGNVTGGNVITTGRVSATGNVYGGNVFAIAPAGASFNVGDYFSNGTIVTLDYIGIGQTSFPVGSTITITDGVEVPGLDGTYVVTAASADQCSFLNNTVASTGNVPTGFSNTFPVVTGVNSAVISTSGNVVAGGYVLGDGSLLTNLPVQPGTYTNSNVATFLSAFGSNTITTTGNISVGVANVAGNVTAGNVFVGANGAVLNDGATTTFTGGWNGANGYIGGISMGATGDIIIEAANELSISAGNIAYFSITSGNGVVMESNLVATNGNYNIAGFDSISANTVSTTGNVTGSYIIGDGSLLTGLPAGYSDGNVVTLLASFGSNVISTTGNVNTGNIVTGGGTGGNITGVNIMSANVFIGDGGNLTNLPSSGLVVDSMTSGANITASVNDTQYNVTALAVSANVTAPTGVAQDGQKLTYRIIDNGTPQALTWDPIYQVIGTTLPTTTVAGKYVYVGVVYNGQETTWDVVSVAQQA